MFYVLVTIHFKSIIALVYSYRDVFLNLIIHLLVDFCLWAFTRIHIRRFYVNERIVFEFNYINLNVIELVVFVYNFIIFIK